MTIINRLSIPEKTVQHQALAVTVDIGPVRWRFALT